MEVWRPGQGWRLHTRVRMPVTTTEVAWLVERRRYRVRGERANGTLVPAAWILEFPRR